MFRTFLFRKLCVLLDNIEQYVTARSTGDNTIQRMHTARWIPKATNTHSEYVILMLFSASKTVKRRPLSVTLYVHCLYCLGLFLILLQLIKLWINWIYNALCK